MSTKARTTNLDQGNKIANVRRIWIASDLNPSDIEFARALANHEMLQLGRALSATFDDFVTRMELRAHL